MPLVVEEKNIVDRFIDAEKGDISTFQPTRETHGRSCSKYSSQTPKDSSSKQVSNAYASETSSTNTTSKVSSSSNPPDLNTNSKEDQLQSTRAEMGEVREENERLKTVLARIMKDYRSLESRLVNASKQQNKKLAGTVEEEPDDHLVSLRLGTSSTVHKKTKTNVMESKETTTAKINKDHDHHDMNMMNQGLRLGLDYNRSEDPKREETGKSQLLSDNYTTLKTPRSTDDHDEVSRQINGKKARVSVRARCDTPTMIDGCQWRKYGQKISKGNPCPRAYYRCTVAPACPVRKQVQRCVDDMSILITTYEGAHNHPLPMGATAMASTTSAAASMLMSGSSSARLGIEAPMAMPMTCSTPNSAFNGLNFNISSPDFMSSGLRQYYQPPNPTITLDLTSPAMSNSSSTTANTGQLTNILSANNYTSPTAPRYTSTNFNLSPMEYSNSTSLHGNPWSNSGYLGYGSQIYNNRSNVMIGNQTQPEYSFHPQQQQRPSFLQKPTTDEALQSSDQKSSTSSGNLTYTIAKAITTDPSFQSSLKDAITSIVSNGNRKEGGSSHVSSFFGRTDGGGGGGSSAAANQQQSNQMALLQSSLGLSTPKSSSASPVENREHMN